MDRGRILRNVPNAETFVALPAGQKLSVAVALACAMLDALEADDRGLDSWEASLLLDALGYLHIGWYTAAVTMMEMALVEPEKRAAGARKELPDLIEVPRLRQAFETAKQLGVMPGSK